MHMEKIPFWLLLGFGIASIGGPLAIASIYSADIIGSYYQLAGPLMILGTILFFFPVFIWYSYSKKIASSGGLYEFVRKAAGERLAKIQGAIWAFSYFLYLPYTVAYILFYIVRPATTIPTSYLYALEIIMPAAIVLFMLFGRKNIFVFLASIAALQLLAIILLSVISLLRGPAFSIQSNLNVSGALIISANLALLFICSSLVLYLGEEAEGGARSIREALLYSYLIVAGILILYFFTSSGHIGSSFIASILYSNGSILLWTTLISAVGTAGLILSEYVALTRLMKRMLNMPIKKSVVYFGVPFVLLDVLSLLNPTAFYNYLLIPSLFALFASQLIVFVVYPAFRKRYYKLTLFDLIATLIACLLVLYGIYSALAGLGIPVA